MWEHFKTIVMYVLGQRFLKLCPKMKLQNKRTNQQNPEILRNTENKLVAARGLGGQEYCKIGEGDQ